MKVQLVVIQGKPEGKSIPLAIPRFKIGRGEGCQLRPSNDQVSREHAMFETTADSVFVQDLGSRNGTEVNGKKLTPHEPLRLVNGDVVKIGPLTFAVSIEGAPTAPVVSAPPVPSVKKTSSLDDISHDDIDTWLVSDASKEPPDRPSGVYGGETLTIESLKAERPDSKLIPPTLPTVKVPTPAPAPAPIPAAPAPIPAAPAPVAKVEPEPVPEAPEEEIETFQPEAEDDGIEDLSKLLAAESGDSPQDDMPEEMMDESNPFYVKKKTEDAPVAAAKSQRDSSDAAYDVLRKMMDRRKASKS